MIEDEEERKNASINADLLSKLGEVT